VEIALPASASDADQKGLQPPVLVMGIPTQLRKKDIQDPSLID
jgi:hypothetical protein